MATHTRTIAYTRSIAHNYKYTISLEHTYFCNLAFTVTHCRIETFLSYTHTFLKQTHFFLYTHTFSRFGQPPTYTLVYKHRCFSDRLTLFFTIHFYFFLTRTHSFIHIHLNTHACTLTPTHTHI